MLELVGYRPTAFVLIAYGYYRHHGFGFTLFLG